MTGDSSAGAADGLPSFEEFQAGSDVLERIGNIKGFQYSVSYQNNGLIARPLVLDSIQVKCLEAFSDVLEQTGLHRLHQVEAEMPQARDDSDSSSENTLLKLTLQDDVYGCQIAVLKDRLILARTDSSLATFYEWYKAIMPSFHIIEATLRRAVAGASGEQIRIVSTNYEFTFNFADFATIPASSARGAAAAPQRRRNLDALQKLIQNLPDQTGEMRDISKQDFVRLDLTLSRVERFMTDRGERFRNAWYFLEAPANERGNYLVYRIQLRNTAIEIPNREGSQQENVVPFDTDNVDDYKMALLDFLKTRAIQGFAGKFLDALDFISTRDL